MTSKPAFTLLELLLVITIIGVLSSILVVDFVGVKQRQELSLMADQSVAMLQQARGDVQAGKVRSEIDPATNEEEILYVCEGAFFEVGAAPLWVTADFDAASGSCDLSTLQTEHYGLSTGEAYVDLITVGSSAMSSLTLFYSPPNGEMVLFSDSSVLSGDASVHFNHTTELDLDISLEIIADTGLISLSTSGPEGSAKQ